MKVSLDTLIKLMSDKTMFIKTNDTQAQKIEIRNKILQRLCEFVVRICKDNTFKVVQPLPPSVSTRSKTNSANTNQNEMIYLSCKDKIDYCQIVID